MSDTQDFSSEEAVAKLRDLVKSSPTCLFATRLTVIPAHVCPMQVQEVDDDGNLWFFSGLNSDHTAHIEEDRRVHLLFGNNSDYEYLTVFGEASISKDWEKIDDLWSPMVKTWFPEGKDDPNLSLIKVQPEKVHYWDTKAGKLVTLARIFAASMTGKVADVGVQGDLKV